MSVTTPQRDKVTYEEAAEHFGVSPETVRSWARAGLIHKYTKPLDKRRYVSIAEIEALRSAEPRREGRD